MEGVENKCQFGAAIMQVVVLFIYKIIFYCLLVCFLTAKVFMHSFFFFKEVVKCFEMPEAVYKFPVVIVMIIITVTKQR